MVTIEGIPTVVVEDRPEGEVLPPTPLTLEEALEAGMARAVEAEQGYLEASKYIESTQNRVINTLQNRLEGEPSVNRQRRRTRHADKIKNIRAHLQALSAHVRTVAFGEKPEVEQRSEDENLFNKLNIYVAITFPVPESTSTDRVDDSLDVPGLVDDLYDNVLPIYAYAYNHRRTALRNVYQYLDDHPEDMSRFVHWVDENADSPGPGAKELLRLMANDIADNHGDKALAFLFNKLRDKKPRFDLRSEFLDTSFAALARDPDPDSPYLQTISMARAMVIKLASVTSEDQISAKILSVFDSLPDVVLDEYYNFYKGIIDFAERALKVRTEHLVRPNLFEPFTYPLPEATSNGHSNGKSRKKGSRAESPKAVLHDGIIHED